MTISYVRPPRATNAPAPAETSTVPRTGSVRLRPGQEVNLSTVAAQYEADQRAQEARSHGLRRRRTTI